MKLKIIDIVNKAIEHDIKAESNYNKILDVLTKHAGKTCGKKLESDLKAIFHQGYLSNQYGSWYSFKTDRTDNANDFIIARQAYNSKTLPLIDIERFKSDAGFARNEVHHRIDNNRAFLKNTKLIDAIILNLNKLQEVHEFIESLQNVECWYSIRQLIGLKIEEDR